MIIHRLEIIGSYRQTVAVKSVPDHLSRFCAISEGPIPGGGEGYDPAQEGAYCLTIQAVLDAPPGLGKASVCVSEAHGEALFELEVAWQEEVSAHAG